jgi:Arc/MetJ family transcription regulator
MRTTITLDRDVAAAVQRLRRTRGMGLSEAVNDLIRRGLRAKAPRTRFQQRSQEIGLRVDVRNVAETLEFLEGPHAR